MQEINRLRNLEITGQKKLKPEGDKIKAKDVTIQEHLISAHLGLLE